MSLQYIEARHAVIAWRNRWLINIDDLFSDTAMCGLKSRLIFEIDMASLKDVMFADDFIKNELGPILSQWQVDKLNSTILDAESDLESSFKKAADIGVDFISNKLSDQEIRKNVLGFVTAAGGVVSLLGATVLAVSAGPIVLTGAVLMATTGFLAGDVTTRLRLNKQEELKQYINIRIQKEIVFNSDGTALRQILRKAIEKTADNILKELSYKGVNHAA